MLYASGVPDLVGNFDQRRGGVQWKNGEIAGNYFGSTYTKVKDPQCLSIAANLRALCTLNAVADSSGKVVLQNPQPGTRGNLGQNVIELPGLRTIDGSLSKSFKLRETKNLRFRIDASNIFNHPQVADPNLDINSTDLTFGYRDQNRAASAAGTDPARVLGVAGSVSALTIRLGAKVGGPTATAIP